MAMTAENDNQEKITALYCRLSVEDIKDDKDKKRKGQEDESNSISNQKQILLDYAKKHGYTNTMFFVDAAVIIGLKTLRLKKCQKFDAL